MEKEQKFISDMLDLMQSKKDNTNNPYKIKVLNRLIAILEEYIR